MKDEKFYDCIVSLRNSEKIPQQWTINAIRPFLQNKFGANTITVYPYNCSISLDGKVKGDYVKKGQKPKFYRINKGEFELISEHGSLLTRQTADLAELFYADFPTRLFYKETRSFVFDLSLEMIAQAKKESSNWYIHDKTINAILLLLFCWNFVAKITKQLQRDQLRDLLNNTSKSLHKLESYSILSDWEKDGQLIEEVYEKFKKITGQTGASKALSLLNPRFFIMWDTKIRLTLLRKKIVRDIGNGERPQDYLLFLKQMRDVIIHLGLDKKVEKADEVAKKVDEYHYVKIIMKLQEHRI